MMKSPIVTVTLLVILSSSAFSQVSTGTPPFGSFTGGPDVINLGNLNAHMSFPVFSKPGRGIPFSYSLGYDSSIWSPTSASGTAAWTPAVNWGWTGQTQAQTGYVPYSMVNTRCWDGDSYIYYQKYWFKGYYDQVGALHPVSLFLDSKPCNSGEVSASATTADGSGYTIFVDAYYPDFPTVKVTARNGGVIHPPVSAGAAAGTIQDVNGNQVSNDGSGHFTDTLGTTALTITGSGTPSSSYNYTYKDSSGTSQSVVVSYVAYTVRTNFGCTAAGISEYVSGTNAINLVDRITYPDGTYYQFTYESTPGYSGPVTGRISQITLPTGGTISYTYFNGNNGIVCSDGSTAAMHRTTSDGDTVFGRSASGTSGWTTSISPPDGNETYINFQQYGSNFYETTRTNYAGTQGGGVVASSSTTCYNGATTCDSAITAAISRITTYPKLANNFESETDTYFNSNGLVTRVDEFDFGTTANTVGGLLRKTLTTYNTTLGNGIVDRPSSIEVQDGSAATKALTSFGYDETSVTAFPTAPPMHASVSGSRGNVTTIGRWRNLPSSSTLTSTNAYYDTGALKTSTDPGGHTTTFIYTDSFTDSSCLPSATAYAFVTQVSDALTHTSSSSYYTCTGQPYSTTDQNGQTTTQTYDSMLRPLVTTRPDTSKTTMSYDDVWTTRRADDFDSSHTNASYAIVDSYGRPSRSVIWNDQYPATSGYDMTDTCYDYSGRVKFVSYPRTDSYTSSKVCSGSGGDTYGYSFAGTSGNIARATVTHGNDSTVAYHDVYGRSTLDTDEGTGSGTTRVQRMSQVDGLGRTVTVCEVSGTTQLGSETDPTSCGLDMPGSYNGFKTAYQYDTLGNLIQVDQGTAAAHTRYFTYDSLSRLLSATTPESGAICYGTVSSGSCQNNGYDSDGLLAYRTDARGILTTYYHDQLHRPTLTTYSSLNPAVHYYYDSTSFVGLTGLTNTVGRLIAQGTADTYSDCGACDVVSYDSMGRVDRNWQRMSGGGSFIGMTYSASGHLRDGQGNVKQFIDGASIAYDFTYNLAGRLTNLSTSTSAVNDSTHPGTLLSSVNYNAFGETLNFTAGASINSGVKTTVTYDTRGRMLTKNAVTSGGNGSSVYQISSSMGYAANGNLLSAPDSVNGTWNYTYDDLDRLNTAARTTSPVQTYTYAYDRYGNRWGQSMTGTGTGPQPSLQFNGNNQITSPTGYVYDASGNITNDTFHTYTYDAENHVTQIDAGTTSAWTYKYDALGRRIKKTNYAGDYWDDYYDLSGRIVTEYKNLTWVRSEIYAGGLHLGNYSHGQTNFMNTDWLGSERMLRDQNGDGVQSCTNLPFGDGATCTGSAYVNALFTDDEHDSESNTEHTLFRQMASTQGRWLSPDPYMGSMDIGNPQSMNRYAYAQNDSIDFTDPSGLDVVPCAAGAAPGTICTQVSVPKPPDESIPVAPMECGFICDGRIFGAQNGPKGNPLQHAWQKVHLPSMPQISRPNCVGMATAAGAFVVGYVGSQLGAAGGAAIGAAVGGGGGTLVAPGVGTIGGAAGGAVAGGTTGLVVGGATGFAAGGVLGYALGNALCSSSAGSGSGSGNNLSPAARSKLGNLASRAEETVRDVIRSRGGNASNVNQAGPWADKTLRETAEAAAGGDSTAETAIKIAKQAGRLGQKF